jgi:hypothetical protein
MPRHAPSDRARSRCHRLRLEPLEDRVLLAAPAATAWAAPTSAAHASSAPQQADSTSEYDSSEYGTTSSSKSYADTPSSSAPSSSHSGPAQPAQTDPTRYYPPQTASSLDAYTTPQPSPELAASLLTAQTQAGDPRAVASTVHSVQSAIVNLPSSTVTVLQTAAGAALLSPVSPSGPVAANPPADKDTDPPPEDRRVLQTTELPTEQAAPVEDVREPLPGRFPFALPGLDPAGWNEAAQRLLRVLGALDDGPGATPWTSLGFWGVAAVSTIVLSEVARQQMARPQRDELDEDEARWRERS